MADTSFTGCIWIVWRICRTSLYTCPSRIVCKPVIWTWSNTFLITIDRIISKIPKRTSSYTWHSSAIFVSLNWTGTIFKTISWCLISIITIRASSYLNTFSQKVISKIVVRKNIQMQHQAPPQLCRLASFRPGSPFNESDRSLFSNSDFFSESEISTTETKPSECQPR